MGVTLANERTQVSGAQSPLTRPHLSQGGNLVSAQGRLHLYNLTQETHRVITLNVHLLHLVKHLMNSPPGLGRARPPDSEVLLRPAGRTFPILASVN